MSLKAPTSNVFTPSAYDAEAVNVSSADYNVPTNVVGRGIYVGGTGDVALTTLGGTPVVFKAVPTGTFISVYFTSIQHSTTTATNLLALS